MKIYLFVLAIVSLLGSFKSNKNDFIEFRHVGESDKYIETLLIVKKERPSNIETTVVTVNENTFDCLYKYLSEKSKMGTQFPDSAIIHGSFRIKIQNKSVKNYSFFIIGRKKSLDFFQGTTEYLKYNGNDKKLIAAIEHVIINQINKTPPIGSGFE